MWDLSRAADSAAGSECCDAGNIPGIFVENSKHQKGSRQDRDKDQPPVVARFLRLVHLACAPGGCFAASTTASRPSFQWIDGEFPGSKTSVYSLKIRPCTEHAGRFRWEILDSDGVLDTSWVSFATERAAEEGGRREMQNLVEMWNKR